MQRLKSLLASFWASMSHPLHQLADGAGPGGASILDGLRNTINSVVGLASTDNLANPLQIHIQQCRLLAKKGSEIRSKLDEVEGLLQHQELHENEEGGSRTGFNWTPAARALHQVLKDAESLIRVCCCGDRWLEVVISQGSCLQETFAQILGNIEWHMSVLCRVLVPEGSAFVEGLCHSNVLRFTDDFSLLVAAKQDLASLRLLRGSHVCDEKICKRGCLADKLLKRLDAEEAGLVDRKNPLAQSNAAHFLEVNPQILHEGQGQALGKGGYADVIETKWLGQKFAWKVMSTSVNYASFMQELSAMAGLHHPNIVQVVCFSTEPTDLGIVMELMDRSLNDLLRDFKRKKFAPGAAAPFPIDQSVELMLQIGEGLRFVHSKGLAHRDVKSHNILLRISNPAVEPGSAHASMVAKIADFGLTKIQNDSTAFGSHTLNTGTRRWMAPEVWKTETHKPDPLARFQPKKMDIYSFGITCYEILSGEEPYPDLPLYDFLPAFEDVKAGKLRPTLPSGTPKRLGALIQRCWDRNPRQRPEFSEICSELRFIKALLLRGDSSALQQTRIGSGPGFNLETGVKVQGPWGSSTGGGSFSNGICTAIQQIRLRYDKDIMIRSIEVKYDLNGTSHISGHGVGHSDNNQMLGTDMVEIKIDDPREYITQIEGTYGLIPLTFGGVQLKGVTSLTLYTNENVHGPFGGAPDGATKFKSEFGSILGFFGRCALALDSIGCYTVPVEV